MAQKETSKSTEKASLNRRTKRHRIDLTVLSVLTVLTNRWKTNLQSDLIKQKFSPNDLCTGYLDMTRDGDREVFMNGFWKQGKISEELVTILHPFRYDKNYVI